MDSLLRWGIENSTPSDGSAPKPVEPRKDLDPAIIDAILGKSDAQLMKEDLEVALNNSASEDERIDALDHFEMLIEQIDNANNIQVLKMWSPLHSLLGASHSDGVKLQALWIIGTAMQNNPSAQASYLSLDPLPTLTAFLEPTASTAKIRSKVIYALSGLLKHNAPAVQLLGSEECDGWTKLRGALQDPDITVRRKTAFLLNSLLMQTHHAETPNPSDKIHANSHDAHLKNPDMTNTATLTLDAVLLNGIVKAAVDGVTSPVPYGNDGEHDQTDEEFQEKAFGILRTYLVDHNGKFDVTEREQLRSWLEVETKSKGFSTLAERLALTESELSLFQQQLQ